MPKLTLILKMFVTSDKMSVTKELSSTLLIFHRVRNVFLIIISKHFPAYPTAICSEYVQRVIYINTPRTIKHAHYVNSCSLNQMIQIS